MDIENANLNEVDATKELKKFQKVSWVMVVSISFALLSVLLQVTEIIRDPDLSFWPMIIFYGISFISANILLKTFFRNRNFSPFRSTFTHFIVVLSFIIILGALGLLLNGVWVLLFQF